MLHLLKRRSFGAMTLCQFLGAFNDNAFKMVVLFLVTAIAATEAAAGSISVWAESSNLAHHGQALPTVLFALPFVIFGPITGAFADRLSKSLIIKFANLLEIMVMAAATLAFAFRSYDALMLVMFLMGTQSAIFGPSKYGVIKELVGGADLSPANALIQSSTMIAILAGNFVAGHLFKHLGDQLWMAGFWYMGFAILGWLVSLRIEKLPAANPDRALSWNPWVEFRKHWRATDGNVHLIRAIYASAFFYLMATLFVQVIVIYGKDTLGFDTTQVAMLNAYMIVGIVGGAMLAGRVSKGRVEGGLIPLGLIGMAGSVLLIQIAPTSVNLLRVSLFGMGFGSGLFSIPIRCLIQGLPAEENRGGVQGLAETMDFVGILLGGGVFYIFDQKLDLTPPQMFLVAGVVMAGFAVLTLVITAEYALRLALLIFTNTVYRLRSRGEEHVPASGGALLVSNHVTFVDAILIAAASPRPVRFLMYRDYFDIFGVGWFARKMGAIPVSSGDTRREKLEALRAAAQAAADGEVVCIFAEGSITRTGTMLPFARGLERIAKKAGVPIIPVGLDRLWGSIFSYERGRFLWKRPHRLPYPVDLLYGTPLPPDTPAYVVRNKIQELIAQARTERSETRGSLSWRFVKSAKVNARHTAVVDGSGARTSYRKLLISSLALRRLLRRKLSEERAVAVMLPPSLAGATVQTALTLDQRILVPVNYTMPNAALEAPLERAGVEFVITSRRFLKALDRPSPLPEERTLYAEDLIQELGTKDKVLALLASLLPTRILARAVSRRSTAGETAVILFSSGSTGEPKGIELTHGNVLSNVKSVLEVINLGPGDAVLGVLPFFHSFGYTVTYWTALLSGAKAVYHANPLDVRTIEKLVRDEQVTFLLATPTFYQSWMRRIEPEAFASVRYAVCGAEKLRADLAQAFEERYGLPLLEGYGCTECSPVVSFNLPDVQHVGEHQRARKPGTIGRPLPGIAVRILNPDTRELLGVDEEGLLEVKGPNVMKGYLKDPERTREVLHDGWYSTGDIAMQDRDGFLRITDRLSRFSKIGGEMVPHGRVEEELARIVSAMGDDEAEPPELAVTALPDERKGEQLVVLHTALPCSVDELLTELAKADLPALYRPRPSNFVQVDEIPKLGTGKTDLKGLRTVAAERLGTLA